MGRSVISLDDLTRNNLGTFKKINEVSLPTRYDDGWYEKSFEKNHITKLAFYAELPVGAVRAKAFNSNQIGASYESNQNSKSVQEGVPNSVYVESLAVLKAYRGVGIGTALLNFVIEDTKKRFIHEIVLHVHVDNTEVIEWYKRKGFEQKLEIVKNYYEKQNIANPHAIILSLRV